MIHERDLQSKCIKWLKQNHPEIVVLNVHGGGWSGKGFPDLLCCINGRYTAFELKVGANNLQDDQVVWKMRILRADGLHYSPYTLDEFIRDVNEVIVLGKTSSTV